jgi:RIO-like serine/threonine protein kinase
LQSNRQVQTAEKTGFEAKVGLGKESLAFLFEEINIIKMHLKFEKMKAARRGKYNHSYLLKSN